MNAPIGARYNNLTVVGSAEPYTRPSDGKHESRWIVVCDCGNTTEKLAKNVKQGYSKTCGEHGRGKRELMTAVGYQAVHKRLHDFRGPARNFACVEEGCNNPATQWSYDHTCPNEVIDWRGYPYSMDLGRYQPRCKSCHSLLDYARKRDRTQA